MSRAGLHPHSPACGVSVWFVCVWLARTIATGHPVGSGWQHVTPAGSIQHRCPPRLQAVVFGIGAALRSRSARSEAQVVCEGAGGLGSRERPGLGAGGGPHVVSYHHPRWLSRR